MAKPRKLAVIGFDSISLSTLETFVERGVMPTVGRLMRQGAVTQVEPRPAAGRAAPQDGALEFELTIQPGPRSRHQAVASLWALVCRSGAGFDRIAIHAAKSDPQPLLVARLGKWTEWVRHTFTADGQPIRAALRARLLKLSPDADGSILWDLLV